MSYQDIEYSENDGNPQELYRFFHKQNKWLYTSGQQVIDFQSEIYIPEVITRSDIEQTNDLNRFGIEIKVPSYLRIAELFLSSPFNGIISVTIFRTHVNDNDNDFVTYWKGRITGGYLSKAEVTFKCEPIASSLNRIGLRAHYQLLCRHVLYDGNCKSLKSTYQTSGIILGFHGNVVQIDQAVNKNNGYYVGGLFSTIIGSRLIIKHEGLSITLSSPLNDIRIGMNVQLYAGCNHSVWHCKNKFNNLDNFGGFPFIPVKNPFSGDAIV